MRSVNRIVRALDPEEFSGLKEKFRIRMPRGDGYERLLGRAAAFAEAAQLVRFELIERGLDPDFIEQIRGKRNEIRTALSIKNTGLAQRVGSTAGLTRRGMQRLRELAAILAHQYRNDADLLAAWKSACHIERDPRRTNEPETSEAESKEALVGVLPIDPPDGHEALATGTSPITNGSRQSAVIQSAAPVFDQAGDPPIMEELFQPAMKVQHSHDEEKQSRVSGASAYQECWRANQC